MGRGSPDALWVPLPGFVVDGCAGGEPQRLERLVDPGRDARVAWVGIRDDDVVAAVLVEHVLVEVDVGIAPGIFVFEWRELPFELGFQALATTGVDHVELVRRTRGELGDGSLERGELGGVHQSAPQAARRAAAWKSGSSAVTAGSKLAGMPGGA